MTSRFLRFTAVGGLGFLVDAGTLYAAMALTGLGPYFGRVLSFLAAVTFTWWVNRSFTFRAPKPPNHVLEWVRFASVNLVGGSVNYTVYALLIAHFEQALRYPFLAVAAGSAAGLVFNFLGSGRLVFGLGGKPQSRRSFIAAAATDAAHAPRRNGRLPEDRSVN